MTQHFRFVSAGLTHEGLVRNRNEDAHLMREAAGVWMVADGMGGHENGQWAAATVVDQVARVRLRGDFEHDVSAVAGAVRAANQTILDRGGREGKRMGSTVAALVIVGERSACLWSGDSRIYRLRGRSLSRLTHDHTQVQEMMDRGQLSPDEAADHPMAHVLSHAVGVEAPMRLDTATDQVGARDVFLLCSDGLTDVVSEPEIGARLGDFAPGEAGRRLVGLAMERGAPDNITVIAVACEEVTAVTASRGG